MAATTLPSSRPSLTPSHISFSTTSSSTFVALYPDGFLELWEWPLELEKPKGKLRDEIVNPTLVWCTSIAVEGEEEGTRYARQCAVLEGEGEVVVAVLCSTRRGSEIVLVGKEGEKAALRVPGGARRLVVGGETGFVLESADGTVLEGELSPIYVSSHLD